MAVPFRRTSKAVKRRRRTHFKLSMPGVAKCANCGEIKLSHRACSHCGMYREKNVVRIKEDTV